VKSQGAPATQKLPLPVTPMCKNSWSCGSLESHLKSTPLMRILTWSIAPKGQEGPRVAPPEQFRINNKYFGDETHIKLKFGTVEVWELRNTDNFDHYFHIHQIAFHVYKINDIVQTFNGQVDVTVIPGRSNVTLILPFNTNSIIKGQFVVHCHILHHEDEGMMAEVDLFDDSNCGKTKTGLYDNSYGADYCIPNPHYTGPPVDALAGKVNFELKRTTHQHLM